MKTKKTSTEIFEKIEKDIEHINKLNKIREERSKLKLSSFTPKVKK